MKKKTRLVLSDAAVADVLEQADWYSVQSGGRTTLFGGVAYFRAMPGKSEAGGV